MIIKIFGKKINDEQDFHDQLAKALKVEEFYGRNLDALWDLLSSSIDRPLHLVWLDSLESKCKLGKKFDEIISILDRVKSQDEKFLWDEKFTYSLK